jgi:hypothetical protein
MNNLNEEKYEQLGSMHSKNNQSAVVLLIAKAGYTVRLLMSFPLISELVVYS